MKVLFLLLFLFLSSSIYAQQFTEYQLLKEQTKKPVPFALIRSFDENYWTYSAENGKFYAPEDVDSVEIRIIGFETQRTKLGTEKLIRLKEIDIKTADVEVNAQDFIEVSLGENKSAKELGNNKMITKSLFYSPQIVEFSGAELARYIPNETGQVASVKDASLYIFKQLTDTILLHLYSNNSENTPGFPLCAPIKIPPFKKGGWKKVLLARENLDFPINGFWIVAEITPSPQAFKVSYSAKDTVINTTEWIPFIGKEGSIVSYGKRFRPTGIPMYRAASDAKLTKLRSQKKSKEWLHNYSSPSETWNLPFKVTIYRRKE